MPEARPIAGCAPHCWCLGCHQIASHRLVLTLHASADTPAATAETDMVVCSAHATPQEADEVLDFGWDSIADTFTAMGKARPDRDCSSAKWVLLDA